MLGVAIQLVYGGLGGAAVALLVVAVAVARQRRQIDKALREHPYLRQPSQRRKNGED